MREDLPIRVFQTPAVVLVAALWIVSTALLTEAPKLEGGREPAAKLGTLGCVAGVFRTAADGGGPIGDAPSGLLSGRTFDRVPVAGVPVRDLSPPRDGGGSFLSKATGSGVADAGEISVAGTSGSSEGTGPDSDPRPGVPGSTAGSNGTVPEYRSNGTGARTCWATGLVREVGSEKDAGDPGW